MAKIIIHLDEHERNALDQLAEREYRTLQAQAAIIILKELEQLGLLPDENSPHSAKSNFTDAASEIA